jgi:hypothetical protein
MASGIYSMRWNSNLELCRSEMPEECGEYGGSRTSADAVGICCWWKCRGCNEMFGYEDEIAYVLFFSLLMSAVTGNCYLGCVFSKYSVSCYCRHGGSRQRKPDMFLSWPTQMALRLVSWGQCLLRIDELSCFVLECCTLHYYLGCLVF